MDDRLHFFEPTICGLAFSETTAVSSKSATSLYHGASRPLRIKFCSCNSQAGHPAPSAAWRASRRDYCIRRAWRCVFASVDGKLLGECPVGCEELGFIRAKAESIISTRLTIPLGRQKIRSRVGKKKGKGQSL
jgi:hypothetical protein